jgi:hypothetical protein
MATTYDKHDAIKMIAHRLDPEQAEGIARAIDGLAGARPDHGDLVTKDDLRSALDELRADLRGEIGELRADLRGEIGEVRGEIGELRVELRGEIGELRREMRSEFATKADLRAEIAGLETRLTRWIIAVLMALLALLVTSVLRMTL